MLASNRVTPLDELKRLLRPAGGGITLFSTGVRARRELQKRVYDAHKSVDDEHFDDEIEGAFELNLSRIEGARLIVLGAPSDVGAGFRRGANLGPWGVREALLRLRPSWREELAALGGIDVGDVYTVPQLLHDDMLAPAQLEASRRALYPNLPAEARDLLPVSPLSIEERALDLVFSLNPTVIPIVIGGDHSTAWPVAAALAKVRPPRTRPWGIVQPDAHTDLLAERLGIKYCFATWSYHANDLIGRGQRMVQVGTRASRMDRGHWERTLDVRQFWQEACRTQPEATIEAIIEHLRSRELEGVYFSNDIDGTDDRWASATGTPEPDGLSPDFVRTLIRRLGQEIGIIAGDVMEVAPPLGPTPADAERTCELAASYLRETIYAALRQAPPA